MKPAEEREATPAYIVYCQTCGQMIGAHVDDGQHQRDLAKFVFGLGEIGNRAGDSQHAIKGAGTQAKLCDGLRHQGLLSSSRCGQLGVAGSAAPREVAARCLELANHVGDASTSFRCQNPETGVSPPTGSQ
jgi:hypothetical protein